MKKSQIALLSAVGFILLCVLAGLILGRATIGNGRDWDTGSGASWNHDSSDIEDAEVVVWDGTSDLNGCNSILVEGLWDIRVEQGEEYDMQVSFPSSWGETSRSIRTSGNTLVLGLPDRRHDADENATAFITMPDLESISIEGAGHAVFTGFDSPALEIVIEGGAYVTGNDSSVEDLRIDLAGGGYIDLADVVSTDADVNLEGAGQVTLDMDGGELTGRINGVGRVMYTGSVSEERISIDGIGTVKRIR